MFEVVLAGCGLVLLIWRMLPRQPATDPVPNRPWPRLSIIIPARNEAANLPRLLTSLRAVDYPDLETIVVDDDSQDDTAAIAARHGVRVIRGVPRPAGWSGKQWACHQGAAAATGELLLFTDADTAHRPDGPRRAVARLLAAQADLLSALPYHDGILLWERLLGPFHVLLLALTAPYGRPRPRRLYTIGQYLLFRREAYDRIGGHEAVKATLVEDLLIAAKLLEAGLPYVVYHGAPLFSVRMYDSLAAFLAGWRRNFRAGFRYGTPLMGFEAMLIIAALTGAGHLGLSLLPTMVAGVALAFVAWRQRQLGNFRGAGVLLFPFALALFCTATVLALVDAALKRRLVWKDRAYEVTQKGCAS